MLKRFGILLASLLWAAYAYSQAFDTGQVSGSARDASGSVIPGVSVTIRNEAQASRATTFSQTCPLAHTRSQGNLQVSKNS